MKAHTVLRKIAALGAGMTMVGATIMGAVAYDLGSYPSPFIGSDGTFTGKIVLGSKGAVADMLGAVDIATSLQQNSVSAASVGGGTVTTSNGKTQDVYVGTALGAGTNFGSPLDNTDLPFLADSSMTIDNTITSETYDYNEKILLPTTVANPMAVETGVLFNPSEKWKDNVFIPFGSGAVEYDYVFKSTLKKDATLANATSSQPVTLNFLGKDLKIISVSSATSFTVQVGNEYFLTVGDTVTVNGKQVKLINVADNANTAVIEVDGVRKTVSGTDLVNGLRVKVQDSFSSNTLAERSATLVIGDEATKSYNDGDAYVGEDKDNPMWVWNLAGLDTNSPTVGVAWNLNIDNWDETDNAAIQHPLYVGESVKLPNDFAEIKFDSMNQNEVIPYTMDTNTRDLYNSTADATDNLITTTSAYVLQLRASGLSNTGFLVGANKADTIYLKAASATTVDVYYKDSGTNKAVLGTAGVANGATLFYIDYSKSQVPVTLKTAGPGFASAVPTLTNDSMEFNFGYSGGSAPVDKLDVGLATSGGNFRFVGWTDDDTDGGLYWNASQQISGWQEDTRTPTGVKVYDPDGNFRKSSGTLKFDMPKDVTDYRANVVIQGQGGKTVSSAPTGAVTVNPIAVGMAVLDTDAPATGNMIVVGGPCVNTVAATLMGVTDPANCAVGFEQGKAVIKLYSAKNAILVAGYSAQDTQGAARVLSNYKQYADKFAGQTELSIVTTSLSNLQVMTK